jgi:hypothetical protein
MHARPGFPANTALAAITSAAADPVQGTDRALSAAFGEALGGVPDKPHPAGNGRPKGTKSLARAQTPAARGFDRPVAVKTIAPRSGHR